MSDEELPLTHRGKVRLAKGGDSAFTQLDDVARNLEELRYGQTKLKQCTGVSLGFGAFIILSVIFVVLQLTGVKHTLGGPDGGLLSLIDGSGKRYGPLPMRIDAHCASTLTPPLKECAAPVVCAAAQGCKGHILVTGGAGYIGSHTTLHLLEAGYEVTVVDNLINSSPESLKRVAKLTGKGAKLRLLLADIRDGAGLEHVFRTCGAFDAVIHFAGLKAVGESVSMPIGYYDNNVQGTLNLVKYMRKYNVRSIIFSSSATVYGSGTPPFAEDATIGLGITNPYGQTKYAIERILDAIPLAKDGQEWSIIKLRYFNPVGAHPSGLIGEQPSGVPNNLMPYVAQTTLNS